MKQAYRKDDEPELYRYEYCYENRNSRRNLFKSTSAKNYSSPPPKVVKHPPLALDFDTTKQYLQTETDSPRSVSNMSRLDQMMSQSTSMTMDERSIVLKEGTKPTSPISVSDLGPTEKMTVDDIDEGDVVFFEDMPFRFHNCQDEEL